MTGCQEPGTDVGRGSSDGVYRYVLGHDSETGETLTAGGHAVVVASERGKEERIDSANQPSRLHPKLGSSEYKKFDATLTAGETDWDVFPSNWWPQSMNGIAHRWTGGPSDLEDRSKKDQMSPVEKYDFLFHPGKEAKVASVEHWNMDDVRKPLEERGDKHSHDEITVAGPATKWELENHGLYQDFAHPDSWWGHCNGWASYATTDKGGYPKRNVHVKVVGGKVIECTSSTDTNCILIRMGDIEALMSELYFSDQATFSGRRCNTEPDEMERDEFGRPTETACRDLNAGSFLIGVQGLLGRGANYLFDTSMEGKPAFVIDHNYDHEIWNFPLVRYQIVSQEEVTEEEAQALVGATGSNYQFNTSAAKFVQIHMNYWMISDSVSDFEMLKRADNRSIAPVKVELNMVVELASDNTILGGEWIKRPDAVWGEDSKKLHPDFYWMALAPNGGGETSDDLGGSNDNPFVAYSKVRALLDCANDPSTCSSAAPPPTGGLSCSGKCGGQVTDGGSSCWCDSQCASFGDCCEDKAAVCDGGDTGAPSCVGNCGGSSGTGSDKCYCDSQCTGFNDCCSDFTATCDV